MNVYLDESSIDNPQNSHMVIGGLFINRSQVHEIKKEISNIKKKYSYFGEIKWIKTDQRKLKFLKELVDYLIQLKSDDLQFHCIVVKKDCVNYTKYHQDDKELAFYKFMYILISHRINNNSDYYIFPDFKPNKLKERVKNLHDYLNKFIYFNKSSSSIKHIQSYDSQENIFIQIADFFSGAVGYHWNNSHKNPNQAKEVIANHIAERIGKKSLDMNSFPSEQKFNIWNINLE
ncbi:DUF3800 domain-containing protein [Candidatus Babeliales bacterium]|nr:DUF3800 domain-containing protein [Candidatus Babeliales bacterium]